MSIEQIARVWASSPFDGKRLLIHLAIADYMGLDATGFCSWTQIMEKARASRATVAATIEQMRQDGYLEVVEEHGYRRATVYRMLWPEGSNARTLAGSKGSNPREEGSNPHNLFRPNHPEVQVDANTGLPDRGRSTELFDHFWSLAVRKTDKGAAREAFAKACGKADVLTVIGPAWRQANEAWATWPDKTKIKHPATWLNRECWDDDPVAPFRPAPGKIERGAAISAAMSDSPMNDREKLDAILALPLASGEPQPKGIER